MIRAVLFDYDGTLADTVPDVAAAGNRALAILGCPTHSEERTFYPFLGDGERQLVMRMLPAALWDDDETVDRMWALYREHYIPHMTDLTRPFPGIVELLRTLRALGIKTAIQTNKMHDYLPDILRGVFGGEPQGNDRVTPLKPHPDHALKIAAALGVEPGECAFVGDSRQDMLAATAAGMLPVGVAWGYQPTQVLRETGARAILEHPSQLTDLIGEINRV